MTDVLVPAEVDGIDLDFALDDLGDLAALTKEMRDRGPATWIRYVGMPALHINTYELVDAGFRDEKALPGGSFYRETTEVFLGRTVLSLDGEPHRLARALQSPFFRQRLMPGYVTPLFLPVADKLIDEFIDRGTADLVPEFTKLYPMRVIMGVLDLPETPGVDWATMAWNMIRYFEPENALKAIHEFDELVAPLLEERRSKPGTDLISALVSAELEGDKLTDADIFSFIRLMFPAGSDTTLLGLGNVLTALLTHQDAMDRVVADPDKESRWAIEEGLRWQPSVCHLTRRKAGDVPWHGIAIPDGTLVALSVMAANHDPAVYPDPDHFDLDRHPVGALSFGLAEHYCLGVHFARAEMDAALRRLLERLPNLRLVDRDAPPSIRGPVLRGPTSLDVTWG